MNSVQDKIENLTFGGAEVVSPLYFARSKELAARSLDGEMMIMSMRDSTLFNLNELGTLIWQSADGVTPLDELVSKKVCGEFDVETAEALADAESFVRELANHGLLTISERPILLPATSAKERT